MSLHRPDRPNAPYQIRKSRLGEKKWMYAHFVSPFPVEVRITQT